MKPRPFCRPGWLHHTLTYLWLRPRIGACALVRLNPLLLRRP